MKTINNMDEGTDDAGEATERVDAPLHKLNGSGSDTPEDAEIVKRVEAMLHKPNGVVDHPSASGEHDNAEDAGVRRVWKTYASRANDVGVVTSTELAAILKRRWWVLALAGLLLGSVGLAFTLLQRPVYSAEATLFVGAATTANGDSYSDAIGSTPSVRTFGDLIVLRPVLERVIARLNLTETPAHLAARLKITPQLETQIVQVVARDPDPQQAALVANTISEEFIAWLNEQQDSKFLQTEQTIRANLNRAQTDLGTVTAQVTTLQSTPAPRSVDEETRITSLQSLQTLDQTNYTDLVNQQQRLSLAQISGRNRVRLVAQAAPPLRPSNLPLFIFPLVGVVLGLALAVGGVMLLERTRRRLWLPEDISKAVGVPVIAAIPRIRPGGPLGVDETGSVTSEAIRSLRTRLQFATFGRVTGVIALTSALPQEGKSVVSANLAMALAQGGQRVTLVDGNLRDPSLHEWFGKAKLPGLANLLRDAELGVEDVLVRGPHPNLSLLLAGTHEDQGLEMLNSKRLSPIIRTLRARSDVVLIDTPSLIAVSDAMLFTAESDHAVMIVSSGYTAPGELRATLTRIRETGAHVAGVVMTSAAKRMNA